MLARLINIRLQSNRMLGNNFSWIRPRGMYVRGIAGRTPGVLKFMELWDKSSEIITMGSDFIIDELRDGEKQKMRKGKKCCSCKISLIAGNSLLKTISSEVN